MSGRPPSPHGPARVHQVTLPPVLAARIAAWGEAQGVPRVKGKPNLSGALAKWAESLPEGCPPEVGP